MIIIKSNKMDNNFECRIKNSEISVNDMFNICKQDVSTEIKMTFQTKLFKRETFKNPPLKSIKYVHLIVSLNQK